jgi:TonB family protein
MKKFSNMIVTVCIILLIFALVGPVSAADERKIKSQVSPVYPELAKSMHIQGTVKVEITISPSGNVTSAKVIGGHPVLADAAVKAVKNWRYDNGPEETRIVSFDFHN